MRGTAILLVMLAMLAGCGGDDAAAKSATTEAPTTTTTTQVASDLTVAIGVAGRLGNWKGVQVYDGFVDGGRCNGGGSGDTFSHLTPTAPVILEDEEGTVIGSGSLGDGALTAVDAAARTWTCAWMVEMAEVPEAEHYVVLIDGSQEIAVPRSELENGGTWLSVPLN